MFLTYRLDFFIFRDNYFKNEEKQGYNTQVTETSSVSSSKIETEHITKTIEKSTISQNKVTSDNRLDDTDTFNASIQCCACGGSGIGYCKCFNRDY